MKIHIYLDDDDLQLPLNVSADAPIVRQYFQVAASDRVRVVAFLTIYDLDFQLFEGNRYKPTRHEKNNNTQISGDIEMGEKNQQNHSGILISKFHAKKIV